MQVAPIAAVLHTTCVATRIEGGHANNALPQRASANVNCRVMPGHSLEEIRQKLIELAADPNITVRYVADDGAISDTAPDRRGFPPPPLRAEVLQPLDAVVAATWPNVKVIPFMMGGASDAVYTSAAGIPTYEVNGIASERTDYRAHGRDERLAVASFYTGNRFFYRYLKSITTP
jgi:acetylornithine deacetylase/succinyl-diaminopimelate desuccinylase-like protein